MADQSRFARMTDGREVAYRLMSDGDGPLVVHTPPSSWPVDLLDEDPMYDRFLRTLGVAGRLVTYDKPGYGSSDPLDPAQDFFEQMTDAYLAVLDATQVEAAWIVGATLAAITEAIRSHPDRVLGAVLLNPVPTSRWRRWSDDGINRRRRDVVDLVREDFPHRADDAAFVEWLRRAYRLGASASNRAVFAKMNREAVQRFGSEVQPISDAPPVLLIRRREAMTGDQLEWWQRTYPEAETVTLEGDDASMVTALDAGHVAELAAGFITGAPVVAPVQRLLRAVLFCDLVDSTSRAAASGDAVWRSTLDRYEAVLERTVQGQHGIIVKHTGDGALATFPSGSEAIAAAVELRNRTRDLGLEGRTGIHVGEVERRGDDIGGIAVNLAARVMGEAAPGEIIVTASVEQATIGGRFRFDDLGTRSLKGIDRPWRVFAAEQADR